MQRPSYESSHRPPLSPRSALRSLQDTSSTSDTAHEGQHFSSSGLSHPPGEAGASMHRTTLGLRPGSSPDIASRSQSLVSPTSLGPGEPLAKDPTSSHSSGLRPSTSATFSSGYPQSHGRAIVEPRSYMFAPGSVFTASDRHAQQQQYHPPTAPQLAERREASVATPSYASMHAPERSQSLSRSLDRNFQHSQYSLPVLPSITEPFRDSQHSDRYSGPQRYDDESTSAYSANTPRAVSHDTTT
jgi:hypothetical protein